jgi:protein TonB
MRQNRLRLFGLVSLVAHAVGALALAASPGTPVPPTAAREWAVLLEPAATTPSLPPGDQPQEPSRPEPKPEPPPIPPAPRRLAPPEPAPHPVAPPRHSDVRAPPAERPPPARPAESQVAALASLTQDAVIVPPRPVAGMQGNRPPVYPEHSRRRREQGHVLLRVDVSADGAAVSVSVVQSSGYPALDEAAAAAVGQWRFVAATRGGTAIAAAAEVPVQFSLAE